MMNDIIRHDYKSKLIKFAYYSLCDYSLMIAFIIQLVIFGVVDFLSGALICGFGLQIIVSTIYILFKRDIEDKLRQKYNKYVLNEHYSMVKTNFKKDYECDLDIFLCDELECLQLRIDNKEIKL